MALDAIDLIEQRVGNVVYLSRERGHLPGILREGERLVDAEAASLGFGRPGLVGLTTERLVHLSFRPFTRRMKVSSYDYDGMRDCDVQHTYGEKYRIRIWSDVGFLSIVTDANRDRNEELQQELSDLCGLQQTPRS